VGIHTEVNERRYVKLEVVAGVRYEIKVKRTKASHDAESKYVGSHGGRLHEGRRRTTSRHAESNKYTRSSMCGERVEKEDKLVTIVSGEGVEEHPQQDLAIQVEEGSQLFDCQENLLAASAPRQRGDR
jgi:hypothetical protein